MAKEIRVTPRHDYLPAFPISRSSLSPGVQAPDLGISLVASFPAPLISSVIHSTFRTHCEALHFSLPSLKLTLAQATIGPHLDPCSNTFLEIPPVTLSPGGKQVTFELGPDNITPPIPHLITSHRTSYHVPKDPKQSIHELFLTLNSEYLK